MFSDSHCHLHMIDYDKLGMDMPSVVAAATAAGVDSLLCVATHLDQTQALYDIANQFPQVRISIGLHPNDEIAVEPAVADYVAAARAHNAVVAIGETGLDYYRGAEHMLLQQTRFRRQIGVARELDLPIIVHTRQAKEDTIAILREQDAVGVRGVMHCFTEDLAMAKQSLDLGFYISFSGIVTFNSAKELQAVAQYVPLDHMLIETDAPFLAPVPLRGQINHPAHVTHVANFIAGLRQIPVEELAYHTTQNYLKLFNRRMNMC